MPIQIEVGEIKIDVGTLQQYFEDDPNFSQFRLQQVEVATRMYKIKLFAINRQGGIIREIGINNLRYHKLQVEGWENREVAIFKDIQLDKIAKKNGDKYKLLELHCIPETYNHKGEPGKMFTRFKVKFRRQKENIVEGKNSLVQKLVQKTLALLKQVFDSIRFVVDDRFANPSPPASSLENTWES